ncbi:MAG: peptide chain release factor N(5)-glutamine methyltransferase [Candidatus Limnocylindrales bacterium]
MTTERAQGPVGTLGELVRIGTDGLRDSGSESARLDAELLMAHALNVDRTTVLAHPEARPGPAQLATWEAAIARRAAGEPVAYIRGVKEFYGIAISVDPRALIPRPESEQLVELADAHTRETLVGTPRAADAPRYQIWDVGTGSGAIAVALAVILRRRGFGDAISILASDISTEALSLTIENAVGHGVADIVTFGRGDLFAVEERPAEADLILANLPYIPVGDIAALPIAASFEPRLALDGGPDGLDVVRRLLAGLPDALAAGGVALLEIGGDQADAALGAASSALAAWPADIHLDLAGQPRVLRVRRPA